MDWHHSKLLRREEQARLTLAPTLAPTPTLTFSLTRHASAHDHFGAARDEARYLLCLVTYLLLTVLTYVTMTLALRRARTCHRSSCGTTLC